MKDIIIIIGILIVLIIMIPEILILGLKIECLKSYEDYNPQFSLSGGCRIEWQGKLTPVEMIRNINY